MGKSRTYSISSSSASQLRKYYFTEFKCKLVEEIKTSNLKSVSRKYKVDPKNLRDWRKNNIKLRKILIQKERMNKNSLSYENNKKILLDFIESHKDLTESKIYSFATKNLSSDLKSMETSAKKEWLKQILCENIDKLKNYLAPDSYKKLKNINLKLQFSHEDTASCSRDLLNDEDIEVIYDRSEEISEIKKGNKNVCDAGSETINEILEDNFFKSSRRYDDDKSEKNSSNDNLLRSVNLNDLDYNDFDVVMRNDEVIIIKDGERRSKKVLERSSRKDKSNEKKLSSIDPKFLSKEDLNFLKEIIYKYINS